MHGQQAGMGGNWSYDACRRRLLHGICACSVPRYLRPRRQWVSAERQERRIRGVCLHRLHDHQQRQFDFHALYGEQTVNGVPGYSALTIPAYVYTYPPDRVFDQKQIDVKAGIGSPSSPVEVGEYIDRDNVTASFGVLASGSYTVPVD